MYLKILTRHNFTGKRIEVWALNFVTDIEYNQKEKKEKNSGSKFHLRNQVTKAPHIPNPINSTETLSFFNFYRNTFLYEVLQHLWFFLSIP